MTMLSPRDDAVRTTKENNTIHIGAHFNLHVPKNKYCGFLSQFYCGCLAACGSGWVPGCPCASLSALGWASLAGTPRATGNRTQDDKTRRHDDKTIGHSTGVPGSGGHGCGGRGGGTAHRATHQGFERWARTLQSSTLLNLRMWVVAWLPHALRQRYTAGPSFEGLPMSRPRRTVGRWPKVSPGSQTAAHQPVLHGWCPGRHSHCPASRGQAPPTEPLNGGA